MCIIDMQNTDTEAGGVPYISPSNKNIPADAVVLEDGTQLYINENSANTANANGLTTVNIVRGSLRLWGSSNANYNYTNRDNIDPENLQDASIRMKHYLLNKLQYDYIDNIDTPMKRRDIDSIIASVQQWLNSLVNEGKVLYATIDFIEDNNSVQDMVSGDFVFDVSTTTTPNAKSITFRTHYTTDGINALSNAGGDE
jgi:phage tail sheath protein FI